MKNASLAVTLSLPFTIRHPSNWNGFYTWKSQFQLQICRDLCNQRQLKKNIKDFMAQLNFS